MRMRTITRLTATCLALVVLAACGGPVPETAEDKEAARAKGRDTDETVFDDLIQTQDKARAVEDLTLGRKGELDAAIEQSEGNRSE
jgi:hypothetical protein